MQRERCGYARSGVEYLLVLKNVSLQALQLLCVTHILLERVAPNAILRRTELDGVGRPDATP
jgi:hypothetical protein